MVRPINLRRPTQKPQEPVTVATPREDSGTLEIARLRASLGELEGVVEQLIHREPEERVVETQTETVVREIPVVRETIVLEDPRFSKLAADMGAIEKTLEQIKKKKPENVVVYGGSNTSSGGGGAATWGTIIGTLSSQSDLQTALNNKSDVGHTHSGLAPAGGSTNQVLKKNSATNYDYSWAADSTGGGGLADGDYGDIVVSASATAINIDSGVLTAAGRAIIDDATAGDQRTTLGLVGSGVGLAPSGGSTTQVLAKVSNADYDYAWASAGAGGGGTQYAEDSVHVSGDLGDQMLAVRKDAAGTMVSADGDYSPLQVDNAGSLRVLATNTSFPVTDNGGSLTVDGTVAISGTVPVSDAGGSLTVDGTVELGATTLAALESITVVDGGGSITVDGAVTVSGTATVSGTVAATQSGTWTVTGAGGTFPVTDSGGTLTVDAPVTIPVFVRLSDGASAISALPITDNSGSITVDGTIAATQSGSWSLAANQSVNMAQINGVTPLMGNGVTGTGAQRVTIASDNTAFTVNAAQSGTWNIGSITTLPTLANVTTVAAVTAITNALPSGTNTIGNVIPIASATVGGHTPFRSLDVDETKSQCKATAGKLFWVHAMNMTASVVYLKIYDNTSAGTTVGTTTPVFTFPLPTLATTNGAGFNINFGPSGITFGTGITFVAVTGLADASTGAPATNAVFVNAGFL